MPGKIFIYDSESNITDLSQEPYESEDYLQKLIADHPEILAGDQISPGSPRKWLLVAREKGVPSEQGGSAQWALDHLLIDQDAIPTLVEVKRSTNREIRREIVGQMLDYAANGTKYWPIDEMREDVEMRDDANLNPLDILGIELDEADTFWEKVSSNLSNGRVRLLFVADCIPPELRRIIEFLNEQMERAEVLGVEINQYRSETGLSTLVPNVIGRMDDNPSGKVTSGQNQWDKDSFLDKVSRVYKEMGKDISELCNRVIDAFEQIGLRVWYGRGRTRASANFMYDRGKPHWTFSLDSGYVRSYVYIQFGGFKAPFNTPEYKEKIRAILERINGVSIPDEKMGKYPSFGIDLLLNNESYTSFIEAISTYIGDINDSEA